MKRNEEKKNEEGEDGVGIWEMGGVEL